MKSARQKEKESNYCKCCGRSFSGQKGFCKGMCHGQKFPVFPIVVFLVAFFWLLNDLRILTVNIPWIPIVLLVLSVGWLVKWHYRNAE